MAADKKPVGPKPGEHRTRSLPVEYDPADGAPWDIVAGEGPVMATAIHAGHMIRQSLHPWLRLDEGGRMREEDPLTSYFLPAADTLVRANRSRFEFDLNRPPAIAVTTDPEDIWGLEVWDRALPEEERQRSLALHAAFYDRMAERVEAMIERHGRIVVFDIHSYNHRRDGAEATPASADENPDIDLGATTLNKAIYGELLDAFGEGLRSKDVRGKTARRAGQYSLGRRGQFPRMAARRLWRRGLRHHAGIQEDLHG